MRVQVNIYDHLTHKNHKSFWCVDSSPAGIESAIQAAFVRQFGSSAGKIEGRIDGRYHARGMVVSVTTEAPASNLWAKPRDRRTERRKWWKEHAEEINARRREKRRLQASANW